MTEPKLSGRGFHSPRLMIVVQENGIQLRGDCDQNPEAWIEITLTADCLAELLGRVVAHQEVRRPLVQMMLDELARSMKT